MLIFNKITVADLYEKTLKAKESDKKDLNDWKEMFWP